ncbi:unnamed protein product [Paramecium primaurelia]|uniref:NAD(P)(+)--arginine ADP-ribosyltransferase n=1 Tax=Paramecium primaurelia TaxID=5886 RepID=A0A8S1PX42_PARPR|nr:unnamed protein product [Paramecium primaurelia]
MHLSFNVDQYLTNTIEQINNDQQKQGIYQKYKIHNLIALKLWTSNLLYRQLNCDLRNNSYQQWKKYLKCLIEEERVLEEQKIFQDAKTYERDKTIQWRDIQAISLKEKVGQSFSNKEGMIFQIEMISSKDISQISVYPNEQEVIMMPFSTYRVLNVKQDDNQPIIVSMREIPFAKNTNNIVLWVDDNPQNNYQIAKKCETQNNKLSIIFCTSTNDAIQMINSHKWLLLLKKSQLRIITDMVRIENFIINYTAGVDLLNLLHKELNYNGEVLIFTQDEKQAIKNLKQTSYHNYQVTRNQSVLENFIRFE